MHTSYENFIIIKILLKEWYNNKQIAGKINKHPSTVGRLLCRYNFPSLSAKKIESLRKETRIILNKKIHNRIIPDSKLEKFILHRFKQWDSPEQIWWRWKLEQKELHNQEEKLSKDTIYKYLYQNQAKDIIKKYLRRKWKRYRNRKQNKLYNKYQIENRTLIDDRPKSIETRKHIWHWEWDTIIWKSQKWAILTNVERKSWYLLASKLTWKNARLLAETTIRLFYPIPKNKKKTITYDNGREFAEHFLISYHTKISIYFAHPYHSWERWTNENTNWLLRQYIPKKTDFNNVTKENLKKYVDTINSRPRKRLWYKTPEEVFWGSRKRLTKNCVLN